MKDDRCRTGSPPGPLAMSEGAIFIPPLTQQRPGLRDTQLRLQSKQDARIICTCVQILRKEERTMPFDQTTAKPTCCEARGMTSAPRCLLCAGELVPVRGAWRCTRCGHALCAGCEPEALPDPADYAG